MGIYPSDDNAYLGHHPLFHPPLLLEDLGLSEGLLGFLSLGRAELLCWYRGHRHLATLRLVIGEDTASRVSDCEFLGRQWQTTYRVTALYPVVCCIVSADCETRQSFQSFLVLEWRS